LNRKISYVNPIDSKEDAKQPIYTTSTKDEASSFCKCRNIRNY